MIDVCGCCEPAAQLTPLRVDNRPGLSAIAYRIGTFASFRETMLARIAQTPELLALATRSSDDYAITTMELWAAVADVLTFYQERYANEAFLRTATQRASIMRLVRLIDYRLGPGMAALARLAFTVENAKTVDIPVGLKVQSVPGQDEQPQIFETLEALTAEARLNRLRIYPVPSATPALALGRTESILDRTQGPALAASLAAGDRLLIFNDGSTSPVEAKEIGALRTEDDRVVLTWKQPVQNSTWNAQSDVYKVGRSFRVFGYNAPAQFMTPESSGTAPQRITWSLNTLSDYSYPIHDTERPLHTDTSRLCLDGRYDGLVIGQQLLVDDTVGTRSLVTITAVDQAQDTLGSLTDTVTRLSITPALVTSISPPVISLIGSSGFFGSGSGGIFGGGSGVGSSFLSISLAQTAFHDRREVIIYELIGSHITFWDFAYGSAIHDDPVYLPGWKVIDDEGEGIEVGRTIERDAFRPGVILRPKEFAIGRQVLLADEEGYPILATVAALPTITPAQATAGTFCHLVLSLTIEGEVNLKTASAVLLGNVALASHGETVRNEVVGSGDASQKFPKLVLKKNPLTYVPSAQAGGAESTLTVVVNGVRWTEVPGLFGQSPTAQVYTTRIDDVGATTLQFGDGTTGAVLPSGPNNVTATYRVGIGLAGRVGVNTLTTLLQRLPGLKEVTNPLSAEGGADPETTERARENAPQTVRTFGRAVSLRDFEDLVMASGEVAKAQATLVWDGLARAVHLTVAAQAGGTFSPESLRRLGEALTAVRDPNHRLRLDNFIRVPILLNATLIINPDAIQADVITAAHQAIMQTLAFEALRLGQAIHLSDVYRTLQDVQGVVSVDVDQLMFKQPQGMSNADFQADLNRRGVTRLPDGTPQSVQGHLRIFPALLTPHQLGRVRPAELGWIETPTQDIQITGTGGL